MAKLPDVTAYRPAPNPSRAIASISQSAAAATGVAMQRMGDASNAIGLQILDREATAQAKDADALAAEKIRQLLYDPETGFANLRGSAAVGARANIEKQLDEMSSNLSANLGNEARRKLDDSLRGRIERAKQTIDTHTSGERRNWINGATEARVNSAFQDSLVDPSATAASIGIIESEYRGMAAREGWSTEELNDKLGSAKSKVHAGIVERIALVDPQAAVGYLSENRGNMIGSDVVSLEAKLVPMAKEWEGRKIGAAAAGENMETVFITAQNTLGMNENEQNAALQAYLKDGGSNLDPAKTAWCAAFINATLAKSGIEGTNSNMAKSFLNWGDAVDTPKRGDVVVLSRGDPNSPQGHVGLFDGYNKDGTVRILGGNQGAKGEVSMSGYSPDRVLGFRRAPKTQAGGIDAILGINDPTTRAAALDEYKLRTTVATGKQKAAQDAAGNAAFQTLESGGKIDDLTFEQKTAIGQEGMTSLRAYERSMAAGTPTQTKPETYMMLSRMQVRDPEQFRSINLLAYSDQLSDGDRKSFIDAQSKAYDPAAGMAASSLMSVATNQLRGVGIKANDPKEALVQTSLLKWQQSFIMQNGKEPTALEVDQKVGKLLMEVVIDPPGLMNKAKGRAFDVPTFKIDEAGLIEGDIKIGETDIPSTVVQEQVAIMKRNGETITPEALISRLIDLMDGIQ